MWASLKKIIVRHKIFLIPESFKVNIFFANFESSEKKSTIGHFSNSL